MRSAGRGRCSRAPFFVPPHQVLVVGAVLAAAGRGVLFGAIGVQVAAVAAFAVRATLDRRQHGMWWPRGFANLATRGPVAGHRGSSSHSGTAFAPPDLLFDIEVDASSSSWDGGQSDDEGESETDVLLPVLLR